MSNKYRYKNISKYNNGLIETMENLNQKEINCSVQIESVFSCPKCKNISRDIRDIESCIKIHIQKELKKDRVDTIVNYFKKSICFMCENLESIKKEHFKIILKDQLTLLGYDIIDIDNILVSRYEERYSSNTFKYLFTFDILFNQSSRFKPVYFLDFISKDFSFTKNDFDEASSMYNDYSYKKFNSSYFSSIFRYINLEKLKNQEIKNDSLSFPNIEKISDLFGAFPFIDKSQDLKKDRVINNDISSKTLAIVLDIRKCEKMLSKIRTFNELSAKASDYNNEVNRLKNIYERDRVPGLKMADVQCAIAMSELTDVQYQIASLREKEAELREKIKSRTSYMKEQDFEEYSKIITPSEKFSFEEEELKKIRNDIILE